MDLKQYLPGIDENIRIYGRTKRQNPLPLFWTASGIEFLTDAADCYLELESGYETLEQWIRVEVNGYHAIRMALNKGRQRITIFRGMAGSGLKQVRLYKENQPVEQDTASFLRVCAVECNGTLLPLPPLKHRIEFVGDSITSGEGLAGNEKMQDWVSSVFTSQGHYAVQTAEALEADFHIVSQCGWGVYCGWNNDLNSNVPRIYDRICSVMGSGCNVGWGCQEPNDFTGWQPEVIVINLGCNDDGAFHNPAWTNPATGIQYKQRLMPDGSMEPESAERFREAVYDFLCKLRRCNPDAYLLWAYGMIGDMMRTPIEEAIAKYRGNTGDEKVSFLPLPDTEPGGFGARMHPGVLSHTAAARVLIKEIKAILRNRLNSAERE